MWNIRTCSSYYTCQTNFDHQKQILYPEAKPKMNNTMAAPAPVRKGWETMTVQFLSANLKDISLLDVGHAQIKSLQLDIADSSAVILSGGTLKAMRK